MAVNDATLNLITLFEGFVPNWYPDPAHGWKVPTCCYGHTDAAGEPKYAATKAKRFTKADGRAILARDLVGYEAAVKRLVKVPLDANQLGALVSFTFNLGEGNLSRSSLLRKLNAKDYHGAANEFGKWTRAGGKVLKGLVRRRAAEAALFTSPV
jgi:lysozyme